MALRARSSRKGLNVPRHMNEKHVPVVDIAIPLLLINVSSTYISILVLVQQLTTLNLIRLTS